MLTGIMIATICVAATGLLIGIFLGVAGKKFAVEVDERVEKITDALPGNNCGGCCYAGCSGLAAAIAAGNAPVNGCPLGGDPVAQVVASIMGQEAGASKRMVAFVKCAGDCEKAKKSYDYSGLESCTMRKSTPGGGDKLCTFGCLGGGDCVRACQFDAIHIKDGIAVVDEEACKACGKCAEVCPRGLISLVPAENNVRVKCNSRDKGPVAMKACTAAYIGCMLCTKECGDDAIHVENFLASIDYDKCTKCGKCAEKCPKSAIVR